MGGGHGNHQVGRGSQKHRGMVLATTGRMAQFSVVTESVTKCKAYHGKSAWKAQGRPHELDLEEC